MKKNNYLRFLAIFLAALTLCLCLVSCSAKSVEDDASHNKQEEKPNDGFAGDAELSAGGATIPADRKIIKTFDISSETQTYAAAITALNGLIAEHNGYVESASSSNQSLNNESSYYASYASYTIRIPAENAEAFVGAMGSLFHITSNRSYVEDISETYYSIEARLEELQVERDALLDMLEQHETKTDYTFWTTVHQRLSEVTQQIAVYQGQINRYDSQIAYSTVHLTVNEVIRYSEINGDNSFGSRLGTAFKNGWNDFVRGTQNMLIWFAEALPTLVLLAIFAVVAVTVVRFVTRKRKK